MGRPRQFDEEAALDLAVEQFWEHGYEATSIRDLAASMGLTTASLYNSFGDKRSLYRQSLNFYVEHSFADRVNRFEASLPPRDAVEAFFAEIVDRSLADPKRKGCMLVNSALELAPHDPEFQRMIAQVLVRVEAFFQRRVESGQADGTISTAQPSADLARMLLAGLLGIRVLARVRPERELFEGIVRPLLAMLDPTIPPAKELLPS